MKLTQINISQNYDYDATNNDKLKALSLESEVCKKNRG